MVPDFKDKFNYYYEPTEALHKFDEVSVVLTVNDTDSVVMRDIIQVIVWPLYHFLRRGLSNKIPLPPSVTAGTLSCVYNRDYYSDYWKDEGSPTLLTIDYKQFWLWSAQNLVQSWMYNSDNKLYLEIGNAYNPDPDDSDIPDDKAFEEYMVHYKPLLFIEIPTEVAHEWLQKCEKLIRDIDEAYDLPQTPE
jgi:hypothetical protein